VILSSLGKIVNNNKFASMAGFILTLLTLADQQRL
jgi:hypothetical protein